MAAVAAAVVAIVSCSGSDDEGVDASDATSRPGDETSESAGPSEPAEGPDTGWFLPPEGWAVLAVETDFLDVGEIGACPCLLWAAARPGDAPAVVDVIETDEPTEDDFPLEATDTVDVGGRPGRTAEEDRHSVLVVVSEGRQLVVSYNDVDQADVVGLADAWLDRIVDGSHPDTAALPLPDGFERTEPIEKPAGDEHLLAVRAREEASGREVEYQLVPSGYNRFPLLDGTSLDSVHGAFLVSAGDGDEGFAALVGGRTDVLLGPSFFGAEVDVLAEDEAKAFVTGMREVTTSEWRQALNDAEGHVEPDVVEAETLFSPPLVEG